MKKTHDRIAEISLWIVEDEPSYREALAGVIRQTEDVVCERSLPSCEDALKGLTAENAPMVMLMDISLSGGMDGIEGLKRVRAVSPSTDVIMLTIHADDDRVTRAIQEGASGYILKPSTSEEIIRAVHDAIEGGSVLSSKVARVALSIIQKGVTKGPLSKLTEREAEILELISRGYSKKEIAAELNRSYFTIVTHVKHILKKLDAHNNAEAVHIAGPILGKSGENKLSPRGA